MSEVLIEVLTFEGCPHAEPVLDLVKRVVAESEVDATVRQINVPDSEAAATHRFLGSPSIRVNGCDIEPGAGERDHYTLSCRMYPGASGVSGEPNEQWLRSALSHAR